MTSQELQNDFQNIKKLYLEENYSSEEIAQLYNVPRHKINYILKKYGIQKSFSEARREYPLNINYFDEIDTPNKAYILGFLYVDGYNNRINNTVVLSLSKADEDILLKIRDEIGSEKPLYYINYVNKNDGVERHLVNMTLASLHMCDMLEKWGMPQNKTFTIEFPNFLREDLYSHFIRGYFDGDGCACIVKEHNKQTNEINTRINVTIMSSKIFCIGLQNFLKEKNNINFNVNHPSGKKEENGLFRSGSNTECKKFMDYIYKDADLYMQRKYDKFKTYFNKD